MGKLIGAILACIFLLTLGWRYFPAPLKERLAGEFAWIAGKGGNKAVEVVKNRFLPKNPREVREEMILELKENVEIIKERAFSPDPLAHGPEEKTLPELVVVAENMIQKLEKANVDVSFKEKIAEKVLTMIAQEKEVCKE
ncbi:MAG: hypothetical protein HYT37_03615 [Candidatus Sungbacteria bacterium]|nr:hypothetical protein [Candidatus Sungbacteria bacterium]